MYFRRKIGIFGENVACKYLLENNYKIVERNFFCRQGEIDIIAIDIIKNELVFIEVKTRCNYNYGNPIESVDLKKQKHIKQVIKYYIYKNRIENTTIRIDIIEIYIKKQSIKINHVKQVL